MSRIKLTDIANGDIFSQSKINQVISAICTDVIPKNGNGAPVPLKDLGTNAFNWDEIYADKMFLNLSLVDPLLLFSGPNDILTGQTRSISKQSAFIRPNGTTPSFVLAGAPTPLVYKINGDRKQSIFALNISGLTLAPSINNTCLVNVAAYASQDYTRTAGEDDFILNRDITLIVDTMGAEITALIGTNQSFKVVNGANTEYFFAFVESATVLSHCRRGYYYDNSFNPIKRTSLANNNIITLMKTGYVFIDQTGLNVSVIYKCPVWQVGQPAAPVTGDYWYDIKNDKWKSYDGVSFNPTLTTFIGQVILDSVNCIGARCEPFFQFWKEKNQIDLSFLTSTKIQSTNINSSVSVNGGNLEKRTSGFLWDASVDFSGSLETYNTTITGTGFYFVYVSETGQQFLSNFEPVYNPRTYGFYHPFNPWRCLGITKANGAGAFDILTLDRFLDHPGYGPTFTIDADNPPVTGTGTGTANVGIGSSVNIIIPIGTKTLDDNPYVKITNNTTDWTFLRKGIYEFTITGKCTSTGFFLVTGNQINAYLFTVTGAVTNLGQFNQINLQGNAAPLAEIYIETVSNFAITNLDSAYQLFIRCVNLGINTFTVRETSVRCKYIGPIP